MNQSEADDLSAEMFDADLPNSVSVSIDGGPCFTGSLTREYVESEEVVGIRSVLLAPSCKLTGLQANASIVVGGETYIARIIQVRGRAISAVILGK